MYHILHKGLVVLFKKPVAVYLNVTEKKAEGTELLESADD